MENKEALLHDYRRVRLEEYASAAAFGVATLVCSANVYEKMQEGKIFPALLYCALAISAGALASSSLEQGGVMSREVSKLEKELG